MAVMAFAGMGMAQDVYSCGSYKVNDEARAAVYKNGSLLYSSTSGGSCRSMVLNPSNGDVYWVRNYYYYPYGYANIFVNNNVAFLSTSTDGSSFYRLYWHDFPSHNPVDCLFAAGRVIGSDGQDYAAFWHGSDPVPFFCPGLNNGHYSQGTGICVSESADGSLDIWCCGYVEGDDHQPRAVVWKNNVLLYTLSNVHSEAMDIVYYDGDIYIAGWTVEDLRYKAKVWKNGEEIMDTDSQRNDCFKVVNGDIYTLDVWGVNKNGERIFSFNGGEVGSIDVNSDGVYYCRENGGTYYFYKDDEILYTMEGCDHLYEIHVAPEVCEDDGARPLPYFEGFEMGATDWTCWTVIDEGENWSSDGYEIASYWQRLGVGSGYTPYNGEYFASHKYGLDQQEGWLISPKIQIDANATLTFQTLEQYASYMDYEGVWISTTTPEPRAFTEVWSQSNASGVWKEVTVDLSAYQGLPVYIAFKYTGDDGHNWMIDDVRVEASTTPQSYTVTTTVDPVGAGTVAGAGTYPVGATVTLTATANPGYTFSHWNDGNTDNPRTVTVTANVTYTATFEASQNYTLTVVSANPTMGSATGGGTFMGGTTVSISATPFSGYYFIGWNDGNADNPRNITVTQNATYIAQFASNPVVTFTLNVLCNTDQGTTVGSGTYTAGATVNIAAVPNAGFEFDKWNDNNRENPRQVTVNSNLTFVAFFKNVGVDENDGCLMAIYPNPASDFIRIEGIGDDSEVRIYNAMGALVKVTTASANEEIGIGELSEGLYLLRCGNISLRFVKE